MKAVPTLADVRRMLIVACVAIAAGLMVGTSMSSSAQAHAGHRHSATAQLLEVGETVGAATEGPALADLLAALKIFSDPVINSISATAVQREGSQEILVNVRAVQTKVLCTCSGSCGTCTSVTCCVAVLASQCGMPSAPRAPSVPVLLVVSHVVGAAVSPLQRPPIHAC